MNIIGNLSGDETSFIYDSSSGRIYQKEVAWECEGETDTTKLDTYDTPQWFRQWATDFQRAQKTNNDTIPSWFFDWLNKINFAPSTPAPSTTTPSPPPEIAAVAQSVMPLWFREWLSRNPTLSPTPPPPNYYTPPPNPYTPPLPPNPYTQPPPSYGSVPYNNPYVSTTTYPAYQQIPGYPPGITYPPQYSQPQIVPNPNTTTASLVK